MSLRNYLINQSLWPQHLKLSWMSSYIFIILTEFCCHYFFHFYNLHLSNHISLYLSTIVHIRGYIDIWIWLYIRLCDDFRIWLGHPVIPFPQFGSSFATFRPAHCFNDSIRPHSYILPASPSYNQSPGSNSPSPTSKIPYWKVCFSFWPFGQPLFALLCSVILCKTLLVLICLFFPHPI